MAENIRHPIDGLPFNFGILIGQRGGVAALYLFGSYARDEARADSDVDLFVEPETEQFYALANFAGAFNVIQKAMPDCEIGYGTRGGLSKYIRSAVEREAVRVF